MDIKFLTEKYFEKWNDHNSKKISDLFSNNSLLRDWTIEVRGRKNIKEELCNVFRKFPDIKCEILRIHTSNLTNISVSEILVHINKEKKTLKVVDIIEFDQGGNIISLKAFLG
uniref:SnoaL-like domain-containing protein n=1 Tax=viral metagenome TaxID=1070528 RepID=A0A6C0LXV3_9ZZZZ